jgi:hypothetical protein
MVMTLNNQVYSFSLLTVANWGFNLQTANDLGISAIDVVNLTYVNLRRGC